MSGRIKSKYQKNSQYGHVLQNENSRLLINLHVRENISHLLTKLSITSTKTFDCQWYFFQHWLITKMPRLPKDFVTLFCLVIFFVLIFGFGKNEKSEYKPISVSAIWLVHVVEY